MMSQNITPMHMIGEHTTVMARNTSQRSERHSIYYMIFPETCS